MKIDLDKPAHPIAVENPENIKLLDEGLTVREELWARFAAAALQGLLANPRLSDSEELPSDSAMHIADFMIADIEKQS